MNCEPYHCDGLSEECCIKRQMTNKAGYSYASFREATSPDFMFCPCELGRKIREQYKGKVTKLVRKYRPPKYLSKATVKA